MQICPVHLPSMPKKTLPDIESKNAAINFLRRRTSDKKPFFLAVGFQKPHIPLKFPREYLGYFTFFCDQQKSCPFQFSLMLINSRIASYWKVHSSQLPMARKPQQRLLQSLQRPQKKRRCQEIESHISLGKNTEFVRLKKPNFIVKSCETSLPKIYLFIGTAYCL